MTEPKPQTTPKPEAESESEQDSAQAKNQVPTELQKKLKDLQANCQQLDQYEEQLLPYKPHPRAIDQTWVDLHELTVAQFDLETAKQELAQLQKLKDQGKPVEAEDLIDLDTSINGSLDQCVQDSITDLEDIARRHGLPEDLPQKIETVTAAIAKDGAYLIAKVAALRKQANQYDAELQKLWLYSEFVERL